MPDHIRVVTVDGVEYVLLAWIDTSARAIPRSAVRGTRIDRTQILAWHYSLGPQVGIRHALRQRQITEESRRA